MAKWLESAPGMAACARARIDLRLTEYLLDLSTATLDDHIRFVTQHGKLAAGASRDKRLKRLVDAKASIKGPKSLSLQLLADRGGKRTQELYLRFARRLKWLTESGAPEWDEYDDWKTHAPTQNERKLRWIRELDRHVTTSTDSAMAQLAKWPLHCACQSTSAPEWVRRHPAFDRFIKEGGAHSRSSAGDRGDGKSPASDCPTQWALYALWVKAPMAPEPFDIQLYVGLAKNGAGQRWQDGHIPDVRRVLQVHCVGQSLSYSCFQTGTRRHSRPPTTGARHSSRRRLPGCSGPPRQTDNRRLLDGLCIARQ